MAVVERYIQLIEGVSGENQVGYILSELEHQSTIDQVEKLAEWIRSNSGKSKWQEIEQSWLDSFDNKYFRIEDDARRDWKCVWDREPFHYFSSDIEKSRALLICFSGRFGWMLLPNWLFLSFLPSHITDVLLIQSKKDYQTKDFVRFKSIWSEIQHRVNEITTVVDFNEIKVLGVSGGCVAATLYASSHRVQGLTLVGVPTLDEMELCKLDRNATEMLKSRTLTHKMKTRYVAGLRDLTAMSQLLLYIRLFPKRSFRLVPNTGHNVFIEMFNRKQLTKALKWIV